MLGKALCLQLAILVLLSRCDSDLRGNDNFKRWFCVIFRYPQTGIVCPV